MKHILFILILILPGSLYSDNVEFSASTSHSTVSLGERFRVTFEINTTPASFDAPDFKGFSVLAGPMQSSSTSVQIINGEQTRTQKYSYSYFLEPLEKGSFVIEPAQAIVDGEHYNTNSIPIEVVESDDPSSAATDPAVPSERETEAEGDLFVRAYASNKNPFIGEQVIITYKIYTKVPVTRYSIDRPPSYQGFWSEDITAQEESRETTTEYIDGQRYRVAEIRRIAIFAQKSGNLTIEPLQMECLVRRVEQRRRERLFEEFMLSPYDSPRFVRETIKSNELELDVKPLPAQDQPSSFAGLVGDFQLSASLNSDQIQTNDAVTMEVKISGNGNLKIADSPPVEFPSNLDTYDPHTRDDISKSPSGLSGSRTFEYLLIPRTAGEYEIPPVELSYFDPESEEYKTLTSEKFILTAKGDPVMTASDERIYREDIRYIDRDIRHIYMRNVTLRSLGSSFFRSTFFYVLFVLPVAFFAVFMVFYYDNLKNDSNSAIMRTKKANRVARKRMKKAGKLLKQNRENEFYDEIFKTLWGYVSDKMNIPVSELNRDNVKEKLFMKGVPGDIIEEFINTIDHCEYARFAPGDKEKNMDEVYSMTHDTIVKTEKWISKNNKNNRIKT